MNAVAGYPLRHALAEVVDFRKPRGKRHPLATIPALSCAAALCGASGLTASRSKACAISHDTQMMQPNSSPNVPN
jgi:hypothetical protein